MISSESASSGLSLVSIFCPVDRVVVVFRKAREYCRSTNHLSLSIAVTPRPGVSANFDSTLSPVPPGGLRGLSPLSVARAAWGDSDGDTSDDCVVGTDGFGAIADVLPGNDGADTDGDGACDAGDLDRDNDGVPDATDPSPADPDACGDSDGDSCDDCVVGTDGFRLSFCELAAPMPDSFLPNGVCLSKRALTELQRMCGEGFETIKVAIAADETTLVAQVPDYTMNTTAGLPTTLTIPPIAVKAPVRRVGRCGAAGGGALSLRGVGALARIAVAVVVIVARPRPQASP